MFKNLFDFSVKRSGLNALGFYIVYVLIGGLLCGLVSALLATFYCLMKPQACIADDSSIGTNIGRLWGPIIGFLFTVFIGASIVTCKKLWKSVPAVLLYIASIFIALPCGLIFTLILVSIITTFDNGSSAAAEQNPPQE